MLCFWTHSPKNGTHYPSGNGEKLILTPECICHPGLLPASFHFRNRKCWTSRQPDGAGAPQTKDNIMIRLASATWHGGLKNGVGIITTESGVLKETLYSFGARCEGDRK